MLFEATPSASAQDAESTPVASKPLTSDEMTSALQSDSLSIPTPGEFFAAMDKTGKTNWQALYRKPIPPAFSSRPQNALSLGGLIADGYLAVEAEDAQQVKNIGKDVIEMAKALGVKEQVMSRGNSINEFAENNEWNTLKEELEATQNEVKLAFAELQDQALITLVTLGGWIRGLEAVSGWAATNYSPESARLLRQPGIAAFLSSKLSTLPDAERNDPCVKFISKKIEAIEKLVTFGGDSTPSQEDVNNIHKAATEISTAISTKQ